MRGKIIFFVQLKCNSKKVANENRWKKKKKIKAIQHWIHFTKEIVSIFCMFELFSSSWTRLYWTDFKWKDEHCFLLLTNCLSNFRYNTTTKSIIIILKISSEIFLKQFMTLMCSQINEIFAPDFQCWRNVKKFFFCFCCFWFKKKKKIIIFDVWTIWYMSHLVSFWFKTFNSHLKHIFLEQIVIL